MSDISTFRKNFIYACMAMGLASLSTASSAALTIVSKPTTPSASVGTAKISWGDEDSLSKARTIMYSNTNPTPANNNSTNYIRRVDNGYDGGSSASTNYNTPSYSASNNASYYDYLPISTKSRGVLVLDKATGRPLYEKNADVARPIASISKILTAMVILDAGQPMDEEIVVTYPDVAKRHYSKYEKTSGTKFKVGDRLNRAEMLLMMLMKSENPAAKALARNYPGGYHAFMRAMNQKAQSLGMTSSFFGDPSGLDKRNVASPSDLAKMINAASHYEVIRRFSTTKNYDFFVANYSAGNRTYPANNTSYLIRNGSYPIGISKTGFIKESGMCMVMETMINNRPAIVVVLGAGSYNMRNRDVETILNGLALRRSV